MSRPDSVEGMPPSPEQIRDAVEGAERMLEMALDPHHVGRVLLHLKERNDALERFLREVDRYFRFGQDDMDRRRLMRQIEKLSGLAERARFPV
jgi:hypothetical protein